MKSAKNSDNGYAIELQEVINFLESNNYPLLPVASAQDPEKYHKVVKADEKKGYWEHCPLTDKLKPTPLYTGKNPSWLDQNDIPHLVNHRQYQNRLPSEREKKKWFANRKNGIGTLGGLNNTVWVDFDTKQFSSQEECDGAVQKILEEHPELQQTFIERTHSGGWRIGVQVEEKPTFTNFALTPGGKHIGEALYTGRFTVLAPTIGPSGNPYESINRVPPVEITNLESIGIYSSKSTSAPAPMKETPQTQPTLNLVSGSIQLEDLLSKPCQEILNSSGSDDRSHDLATILNEAYGWLNWGSENRIDINGNAEDIAYRHGASISIDAPRIGRIIKTIDVGACKPAAYHQGRDESCWKKIYKLDRATFEAKCPIQIKENIKSEWRKNSNNNSSNQNNPVKQNGSVTGDSQVGSDSQNVGSLSITATVTTVTQILEKGFPDWLEINKLENVRSNSELYNKEAFYALVRGIKCQFDDVQPEDEVRLESLINWHNTKLDFHKALPSMAEDILHDAKILNIDPIAIWQHLLPAILSLVGKRVNLDLESHTIPAIVWTCLVGDSGAGKTRGEKLVVNPLRELQKQAKKRFEAELAEWEETIAKQTKKQGNEKKPPKPVERKYLFDVATIQAVMKRQSEQKLNGSLWARDEIVGIFQSFGQFSKGENEALSCLLTSWDGGSAFVDRVSQEDSYVIDSSRLNIAGGIQEGVFNKAFKDPTDAQGLQARFLFAKIKAKKPKRVKGFCTLSEKLPQLYQWLDNIPEGKIKLSPEADHYYTKLFESIGEQAINTSMPAIRAWMNKLPGQLMRIAQGLHLIECYHNKNKNLWTLTKDTLERAVLFAQYYRSTFHIVQTTAADTDDMSAILLQIWDKAITRHPEGISTRDAYRDIKAIQYRAKDAGRPVSAYTADLFGKLEQMGKGSVVKNGRLIKFVAILNPPPISPDDNEKIKPESTPPGDRVTIAATVDISTLEVSPRRGLSPVTLPMNVVSDTSNSEVEKEPITPPLEQINSTSVANFEGEFFPDPWEEEATPDVEPENTPTTEETQKGGKGQIMWAANFINPSSPNQQPEDQEWKDEENLKEMAKVLSWCDSIEKLQKLREIWRNPEALNAACKLLTPEKHAQIKEWVIELNKTHPLIQIGDSCTYSGKEFNLERLCRKHQLQIVEINGDEATVVCSEWYSSVTNVVPLADLKLIR